MQALYDNIKRHCRSRHITVFDLEVKAGLPFNTITTWGKRNPRIDKVKRVADSLDVSIDELLKEP